MSAVVRLIFDLVRTPRTSSGRRYGLSLARTADAVVGAVTAHSSWLLLRTRG
ncbi:hypothetical protein [Streptomyces sp. CL12-4]|uniref:hypothetical protein n=1 Tax=Streptomyces sp. CL12-4 TaxID=2810306 RepID=UPI001EFA76B6|nr:hypothetical protein [Streptomyces sp. CL12-4]MCG8971623.1 hypothetical protein [Streptomyces sp. CL12-4]